MYIHTNRVHGSYMFVLFRKGPVQAFFYVYVSRIVSGDTGTFLLIE